MEEKECSAASIDWGKLCLIKCCMGLCVSKLKKQGLCRPSGTPVKLDGRSETLVRRMDRVACIIQFFSYCVPANLITRVQSVSGELRHLLHKWHRQKKEEKQKSCCV